MGVTEIGRKSLLFMGSETFGIGRITDVWKELGK